MLTTNSFYPDEPATNHLNKLLSEMDRMEEGKQQEKPGHISVNCPPPISMPPATAGQSSFNVWTKENSLPSQPSLQNQRQHSLNRTTDIFKRANSSVMHSNELGSPSLKGEVMSVSYTRDSERNFDQAIHQQRDAFFQEKMEQQHKLSLHRKNSHSRQSIESANRKQREESIKA